MKIISKFKDYYDHLQGKYGVDPKIVFDRTKKLESVQQKIDFDFRYDGFFSSTDPNKNVDFRILVICGKYYPLVAKGNPMRSSEFRLVKEEDLSDEKIRNGLKKLLPIDCGWFAKKDQVVKILKGHLNGVYNEGMRELSKKINTPVFIIVTSHSGFVEIDGYSPNLSKIKGISSIYSAELLFNDISFFIGNVLNNNIDQTHLIISDKDKIVKGGFDLKTSFRKM